MRPEHRVPLALGGLVLAAALGGLGLLAATEPPIARGLLLQVASHLAMGKETGIPVGIAAGVPPALAWAYAVAQDASVLLLGFPLLLGLRHRLERTRRGARFFAAVEARARAQRPRSELLGAGVLAATTWIPMLPTGALFAAAVGATLGYRARVLLPLLLTASALACLAYALAAARLLASAENLDPRLPLAAAGALVVLLAGSGWLMARRIRAG